MTQIHQEIRTYCFSEKSEQFISFRLKPMSELYRSAAGASDSPHRHDYYSIIFIEKAEGAHFVDFTEYKLQNNSIFFILPGQMHQLLLTSEPTGWIITFTDEFLIGNAIPYKMIDDIFLFNEYGQSPPLPINDRDLPIYQNLMQQMNHFANSLETYTLEAVGALVKLFLIQGNNHCSLRKNNNPQFIETTNHLLRAFKKALNSRYATAHLVSDYASELAVTSDYLNKTVKNLTGKSAKVHIQNKLIIEAKRALLFSNISNKELAFKLGFDEPAHFNNFFKKITSQTPTEFRNSIL